MGSMILATANSAFVGKIVTPSALIGTARPANAAAARRVNLPQNQDIAAWLTRTVAEATALLAESISASFDRSAKPVAFSTGEAAIAVGWSSIEDLKSSVSSVSAAITSFTTRSVESARTHFGDDIASQVQQLNEAEVDAARYWLDYRIFTICRAFTVCGNLIEMDDNGKLSVGSFTLSYKANTFRAAVNTDRQAVITENGATRQVSVGQVTTDLACGKLSL